MWLADANREACDPSRDQLPSSHGRWGETRALKMAAITTATTRKKGRNAIALLRQEYTGESNLRYLPSYYNCVSETWALGDSLLY